jgi:hypothetical protein
VEPKVDAGEASIEQFQLNTWLPGNEDNSDEVYGRRGVERALE